MIVIDTSVLVDALSGPGHSAPALRMAISEGRRFLLPTLVLFEWLRGPRRREELEAQEALLPREQAIPFGVEEAAVAARLYSEVSRPRGREVDLAIAASALTQSASLWTLNKRDFQDIPGLELY